jgi:hypothetical protein
LLEARDRSRKRRLGAFVVLAVGTALVLAVLEPDWPREQPLIFRLPNGEATPLRLDVALTEVGAARALQGFSIALESRRARDVRHSLRVPNGDYLVTIELTSTHSSASNVPAKIASSAVRRVTLTGEETLIVVDGEGSE